MTSDDEALHLFDRAARTLDSAKILLEAKNDVVSVVNRAYYAVFYAAQALLQKRGIRLKTSKHVGVIEAFDFNIVKQDREKWKKYSKILHELFDKRMGWDYDDQIIAPSYEQAKELFNKAKDFYDTLYSEGIA